MKYDPISCDTLYEDQHLHLYYDAEKHLIIKVWKQPVSEDTFRLLIIQLLMQIVGIRAKYPSSDINIIADCRKLGEETFTEDVIDWLNEKVHRLYVANRIRKKAFIAAEDVMANLSIVGYISSNAFNKNFHMNIFKNEKDAEDWIKS